LRLRFLYERPDATYALQNAFTVGALKEPLLRIDAVSVYAFGRASAVRAVKFCVEWFLQFHRAFLLCLKYSSTISDIQFRLYRLASVATS